METMMKKTHVPAKTVRISEIFHSLQGEGPWQGLSASFIRLAGCTPPLCPWCDTPHALEGGEDMTIQTILRELAGAPSSRVVITGGEPFLQWESGLSDLHDALADGGREIQYETSGKVGIPAVDRALVVCSPKHVEGAWRFHPSGMERIHFFKFLAGGGGWFEVIDAFIEKYGIEKDRVYIMPLGATREEQIRGMEAVFSYCARRGYRMSARLHVLAFDTRRGV